MLMDDKNKTRIRTSAVTSHAPDRIINYSMAKDNVTPTILLSIGSALLTLSYMSEEKRDADLKRLDEAIEKE